MRAGGWSVWLYRRAARFAQRNLCGNRCASAAHSQSTAPRLRLKRRSRHAPHHRDRHRRYHSGSHRFFCLAHFSIQGLSHLLAAPQLRLPVCASGQSDRHCRQCWRGQHRQTRRILRRGCRLHGLSHCAWRHQSMLVVLHSRCHSARFIRATSQPTKVPASVITAIRNSSTPCNAVSARMAHGSIRPCITRHTHS